MVQVSDWISEGVNMIKEQFWAWVLVMLVYFMVVTLVSFTCIGLFIIPGILFFGPHAVALKQLRGGRVEIGDVFSTFNLILPGLGFFCIIILITLPSMLLFGLPMLFIMPLWIFVPHLIIDRKMGLIEAMKASQQRVKRDYWWFVLTNFLLAFLANLGTYACYVGLLVTAPIMYTAVAVAYRECFGCKGAYSFSTEALERAREVKL